MTQKEIENKIANYYKIFTLTQIYEEEFINKLGGRKQYKNYINETLDAIIFTV